MRQDSLYEQAADTYGSSLDRLARAYELDTEARRDLLQEIHLQLWRSFAYFDQRCSLNLLASGSCEKCALAVSSRQDH